MVPFLVILGGQVIRVAATAAARRLAQLGAQRISAEVAKKAGGRVLTARTAGDASKLFAKYGKDIAKYRPATQVKPSTKVVKPKPKPKPDAKPKTSDKPKSNVRADRKPVRGSRIDVKPNAKKLKPDTKVAGSGRGGSRTTGAPSKRPSAAGAAGKRMPKLTRKQKIAAGIGIGGAATAVLDELVKPKGASAARGSGPSGRGSNRPASRRNTTGMSDAQKRRQVSKSTAPGMSAAQKRRQVSKSTSPTVSAAQKKRQTTLERGVGRSTLSDAQKKRQTRLVRSSSPTVSDAQKKRQTRLVKSTSTMSDAQKRRATRITAGPNVGFGPKGNIFPKDAADRRRLMAKYGGTGSAAARAAAQGKQGNMKKGSK